MGLNVAHSSLEYSAASAGASAAGACILSSSGRSLSHGNTILVVAVIAVQGSRVARRCLHPAVYNQGNKKAAFVAASPRMRSCHRLQCASPLLPRRPHFPHSNSPGCTEATAVRCRLNAPARHPHLVFSFIRIGNIKHFFWGKLEETKAQLKYIHKHSE